MHFRVVSKGQGTELGIFFGLHVKFQLFGGGGLDTPDNFGGYATSKPMYEGKIYSITPPPPPAIPGPR